MSSSEMSNYVVLVVEDTVEFAKLTMMMLQRIGLKSVHAEDGDAAVEYITHNRPDLVLLDLNLPGASGWEVLEHLYAMHGDRSVPVIVTSAYSDGANRLVGRLQDVRHYLIKPFPAQALTQSVMEALNLETENPD